LQSIISGILIGGIYGLVSMGLSLIFGVMRIVNFAHGELVMLAMYGTFFGVTLLSMDPFLTIVLTAPLLFLIGVAIQKYFVQSLIGPNDTPQLLLTVGISLLLQNIVLILFTADHRSLFTDYAIVYYNVGGISINKAQLYAFIVALLCSAAMSLFLTRTDMGKALRATVNDLEMAELVGIDTKKIYMIAFGIGAMLAGIGGSALMSYYPANPTVGHQFLVIAFVSVVMAGMGNALGAFISGMIIGVIQQLTATYIAVDMQNVAIFVLFILLLVFRPNGIFSRKAGARI